MLFFFLRLISCFFFFTLISCDATTATTANHIVPVRPSNTKKKTTLLLRFVVLLDCRRRPPPPHPPSREPLACKSSFVAASERQRRWGGVWRCRGGVVLPKPLPHLQTLIAAICAKCAAKGRLHSAAARLCYAMLCCAILGYAELVLA